jgi:5-formyltetrahydrofolate cyclo-ligase
MQSAQIRKRMRSQRLSLSPQTLKLHSQLLTKHLSSHKSFRYSRRIALYIACKGEMDPAPLLQMALESKKQVYLPLLNDHPANSMRFIRFRKGDRLINNRFGIPEPRLDHTNTISPWALDLVLVPLVAFDHSGNRLGMGGGYYDRTFAFKNQRRYWKGPRLIGIAHDFQQVDTLVKQPWDIPLDAVITEAGIYNFKLHQT